MSSFTSIAPYYEDLMDGVPYAMWVSYLKLLWANIDAKPRSVLEVCCGTGKLCRLLTAEGYSLTGVDLSREMIRVARKLAPEIHFEAQDAAEMHLGESFDAAFSFFDSLNYITDPDRTALAIRRVAEHLRPGASFAFDLNTQYAFEQDMFSQEDMKPGRKVRYKWQASWDEASRICAVHMDFWAAGRHFVETHHQRAHSLDEIEAWMSDAGFVRLRFYDAYTLDPPRGRSDRIHVVGVIPSES
jgi:SAM-dependent methyltransferase